MYCRIALTALLLLVPISLAAQDAAPPADAGEATAKPGEANAEFHRVLGEFKGVLAELGILQDEYRTADDGRREEIKAWQEIIEKGDVLEPQLLDGAEKAFVEAPNADEQVTDLLLDVVGRRVAADDFEEALRIGNLLAKNDCKNPRAYNLAGVAAFAMADFDAAEEYLARARKARLKIGIGADALDRFIKEFLKNPDEYKQSWAREEKIRTAEDEAGDLPVVLLKTNRGDIKLLLFENEAPNTVANFISLIEKGFYDGLTFHRVLSGFVAQGGCPDGTGSGGPEYEIPCECYQPNHREHFRGSLSMAHSGRDTGGSQFFLAFLPTALLNGRHTVFGRVIEGFDVLAKIQRRDPDKATQAEPDTIVEAKVLSKRDHDYVPRKSGDEFNE